MDVHRVLTVDSLGKLLCFDSKVQIEPLKNVLRMRGIFDGLELHVEIRCGDFSYSTDVPLPQRALLSDAFSPQMQLPNLATGQTWTVPVISPLRPTNNLMQMLYATVQGKEPIYWNGEIYDARVVVYRNDPGVSFGDPVTPQGKLWVLADGTVIKQQTMIFDSALIFVRMPRAETERLVEKRRQTAENDEQSSP